MSIASILLICVLHNAFGILVCAGIHGKAEGFEFCNPLWLYKNYSVNVFGAILLAIIYSLLCPIGAIGYWMYKLRTFGRR